MCKMADTDKKKVVFTCEIIPFGWGETKNV